MVEVEFIFIWGIILLRLLNPGFMSATITLMVSVPKQFVVGVFRCSWRAIAISSTVKPLPTTSRLCTPTSWGLSTTTTSRLSSTTPRGVPTTRLPPAAGLSTTRLPSTARWASHKALKVTLSVISGSISLELNRLFPGSLGISFWNMCNIYISWQNKILQHLPFCF